ncbi:MAG: beta strand repeat-containing protein, partial [Rhabdochlamydiaceae bacterium]
MKGWKHLFLFSTLSLSLSGVDYSWQTTSPSNWSDSSAWNPSGYPNSLSDTATFDNILSAPTTVTVDNIFSVDLLNFNSNFSYTLSQSLASDHLILGGGYIVLASTNTADHFINVPLVLANDLNINFAPGSNGSVSLGGYISGPYSLTLTNSGNGVLIMSAGQNIYTGLTSILAGTMRASSSNVLPPTSNLFIDVSGTFDLNSFNNTIFSLSGSGSISLGGGNTLTVTNGGNFFGGITGTGGLTLSNGTLVMATPSLANTYSGLTSLQNNAILQAAAVNAFSSSSSYSLTENATLDLHGFDNTIKSLQSIIHTTTVKLDQATLTINGGLSTEFSGQITNVLCGGLTISGGTSLLISNSNNDYCGLTSIVNGTLQLTANDTLSPNTDVTIASAGIFQNDIYTNRAQSIINSGTISNSGQLLANSYTQSSGAALNLDLYNVSPIPEMIIDQNIFLNGSLTVTDLLPTNPVAGDSFILMQSNSGSVISQFSSVAIQGFNPTPAPRLVYTLSEVVLYFAGCAGAWNKNSSGNWGDTTNWLPSTCAPGTNGNQNDLAIFNNEVGFPAITVTLANTAGTAALPITLFQLNLDALTTQYTINQFSNSSIMTFDGSATPQINVMSGNHTINAPLVLNQDSELVLADGAILNFNANTTLQSASTQNFIIRQSTASTMGSGLLVNQTTLTPYSMSITSASMQNYGSSTPLNSLDIGGNTGTTVIVNAGANALLGPTGQNGNFTIGGTGSATIINTGQGAKMGSFGAGGLVTITSGHVTNSSGAVIQAGLGGTITISGGTVTNDLTSTIGSPTENLVLSGG